MSVPRRICVVTGTRAEYGLLRCFLQEVRADASVELQILATGMHLAPEFGLTYREIEGDGFRIDRRIEMLLSSDTPVGLAKSMGLGTIGFADAYAELRPDFVVVLGDRFEILAAVQAALVARIPVAHICGGETTEGAIDESIRHAVTKLSHLHFPSTAAYARRIVQLGEDPARVHCFGSISLDNLRELQLLPRPELESQLGLRLSTPSFLVTYHPVTLDEDPAAGLAPMLEALDAFPDATLVFTKPNADTGGRSIIRDLEAFVEARRDRAHLFTSLGSLRYLSLVAQVDAVVGNSSSALMEVPALGKPSVDIGDRQRGRLAGPSVLHCPADVAAIRAAIQKALAPSFAPQLDPKLSPYASGSRSGSGSVSAQILDTLKQADLRGLLQKPFHDLPFQLEA